MSGLYWLPLYKTGKSSYHVVIENKNFRDIYSADFSGEFDFQTPGFCTVDALKKIIAEKTADLVVKSIKNDYK